MPESSNPGGFIEHCQPIFWSLGMVYDIVFTMFQRFQLKIWDGQSPTNMCDSTKLESWLDSPKYDWTTQNRSGTQSLVHFTFHRHHAIVGVLISSLSQCNVFYIVYLCIFYCFVPVIPSQKLFFDIPIHPLHFRMVPWVISRPHGGTRNLRVLHEVMPQCRRRGSETGVAKYLLEIHPQ